MRMTLIKLLQRVVANLQKGVKSNYVKGQNPPEESFVEVRGVKSSYKATYFISHGAHFAEDGIILRPVPENKRDKKGFTTQWIFNFKSVPKSVVDKWGTGKDLVSASQFGLDRIKLKRSVARIYK